jgi:3-oxoacyl-[acyl-carrier protein] reductase
MDLGLKNKIAMVGGASKGLGYAVARALAAEGAVVSMARATRFVAPPIPSRATPVAARSR